MSEPNIDAYGELRDIPKCVPHDIRELYITPIYLRIALVLHLRSSRINNTAEGQSLQRPEAIGLYCQYQNTFQLTEFVQSDQSLRYTAKLCFVRSPHRLLEGFSEDYPTFQPITLGPCPPPRRACLTAETGVGEKCHKSLLFVHLSIFLSR